MKNLPECYEPNDQGQFAEGMTIRADALSRTGYRLPTEAESKICLPVGDGHQPLLRGEREHAGALCVVLGYVTGPSPAVRESVTQ